MVGPSQPAGNITPGSTEGFPVLQVRSLGSSRRVRPLAALQGAISRDRCARSPPIEKRHWRASTLRLHGGAGVGADEGLSPSVKRRDWSYSHATGGMAGHKIIAN